METAVSEVFFKGGLATKDAFKTPYVRGDPDFTAKIVVSDVALPNGTFDALCIVVVDT